MPAAIPLAPGLWRVPTVPLGPHQLVPRPRRGRLGDPGGHRAEVRARPDPRGAGRDRLRPQRCHDDRPDPRPPRPRRRRRGPGSPHRPGDHRARRRCRVRADREPPPHGTPSLRLGRLVTRTPGDSIPRPSRGPCPTASCSRAAPCASTTRPGHTPGHCSLLHEPSGTLITGDAIWNMRSRRTWPVLAFCTNAALTAGDCRDAGRPGVHDRGVHPRPGDPGHRPGGDPRVPGPPAHVRPRAVASGPAARTARTEPRSDRRIGAGAPDRCVAQVTRVGGQVQSDAGRGRCRARSACCPC